MKTELVFQWTIQKEASELLRKILNAVYRLTIKGRFKNKIFFRKMFVNRRDVLSFELREQTNPRN